jgi:hypothetical protein
MIKLAIGIHIGHGIVKSFHQHKNFNQSLLNVLFKGKPGSYSSIFLYMQQKLNNYGIKRFIYFM